MIIPRVLPGEEVVYFERPHWSVLVWPMVVGVFCGLPGLVRVAVWLVMEPGLKPASSGPFATSMLAIAGLLWLGSWLRYLTASFVMTSRQVILQQGVIQHKRMEIALEEVTAVDVFQGILGEELGYGSVVVHGRSGRGLRFTLVPDPQHFRQRIEEQRSRVLESFHEAVAA
jgi:uncharacterized membrane protein YdbT with pleckstrin-like domain